MKSTGIHQTVLLSAKQAYRRQALRSILFCRKWSVEGQYFLALIAIALNVWTA